MSDKAEMILELIENKYNEHESMLSVYYEKYPEPGVMMDNDDTAMIDYHEGAIEALGVVLNQAKEIYNG